MQQATINFELGSTTEAEQFLALLTGSNHIFNISIKLNWKTTRAFLEEFCREIADTGTVALEIDGVTPDMFPKATCRQAFVEVSSKDMVCDNASLRVSAKADCLSRSATEDQGGFPYAAQGRIIAQLVRQYGLPTTSAAIDARPISSQQEQPLLEGIEYLHWDCDEISFQLDDYSASLLDTATQQHPSALTLFTLDVSQLSCKGLTSVERVLGRSSLEKFKLICTSVNPTFEDSVARVLGAVQWSTLKSLKLSGEDIDTWIYMCITHNNPFAQSYKLYDGPQLLYLHLQGTGSSPQLLSHTSALFVHGLVYLSPLVEAYITNVILEEDFFTEEN
ncbi:hypothetical protein BG000_002048 [Podila horticola]|nr:hypothetical protein BG000_002048 [Podila horticola]